jgi:hypothetical protein
MGIKTLWPAFCVIASLQVAERLIADGIEFLSPPNAGVLLGEDSAFQADGAGSNPVSRSN